MCPSVRLSLPLCLLASALAVGGCTSAEKKAAKKMAKEEQKILAENSRATEERKMRAINYGDVNSKRGADVLVWDPNKKFDPSRSGIGAAREFGTGGARTKEFNFVQKATPGNFLTRAFGGAKGNSATDKTFATSAVDTQTRNKLPGAVTDANKTANTKVLSESTTMKTAATRDLPDGNRPYLGKESRKFGTSLDAKSLADWRNGAGETVIYNGDGTIDRLGGLKKLSIDDIRDLLNKNK